MEIQIEQIPYYLTWKLRHEVMYPELTVEDVKLPEDTNGLHFGLYLDRKLTSVVSLFEDGQRVHLRKFATLQEEQKKGYGKTLLEYVLDLYDHRGNFTFWCSARTSAAAFYEKFGFKKYGQRWEASGHIFIKMERIKDLTRSEV